jgi:hypothetical protein
MAKQQKIKIDYDNDDQKKQYPEKVVLTSKASEQLKVLKKIFNEGVEFYTNETAMYVEVKPRSLTYSKNNGSYKNTLDIYKELPCDITTFANKAIGELFKRATAKDTVILYDYCEDGNFEPKKFGVVKNGKLHFGLG